MCRHLCLPFSPQPLKWSDYWLYVSRDTAILKLMIFLFLDVFQIAYCQVNS